MKYTTALFDLDGTLTDPKMGITKSVRYALEKFGIEAPSLESLIPFIGPPLQQSFQEFHGLSSADSRQAVEYYREYFSQQGIFENEVYNGIDELLGTLMRQGLVLVVATSKPTLFATQILEHFRLSSYFSLVVGSNLDGTLSEKTEIISSILERLPLDRSRTVMVGDRKHDLIGARNCGIPAIAVGYGYGSREELENEHPTHYADSVKELRQILFGTP